MATTNGCSTGQLPSRLRLQRGRSAVPVDSASRTCNRRKSQFTIDVNAFIHYPFALSRGHSSAGRALQWHCRGRRFDPDWLHQDLPSWQSLPASPSSRGLGHRPFTAVTGVRIPLGTPYILPASSQEGRANRTTVRFSYEHRSGLFRSLPMEYAHLGGTSPFVICLRAATRRSRAPSIGRRDKHQGQGVYRQKSAHTASGGNDLALVP